MAEYRAKEFIKRGNKLFEERLTLTSQWQDIAENFYPERADFTTRRSLGEELADNLTTSFPILARRDLGNAFSSMLRHGDWFGITTSNHEETDNAGKRWLDFATITQRNAMYDRVTQFVRATKEADHDFAAFGQCVLSVEMNRDNDALLYRSWHLRDVVWCENADGVIDEVYRKWCPYARDIVRLYGDRVHGKVRETAEKDPYKKFELMHIIMSSENYSGEKKYKTPFVSVHIDVENCHVMSEEGTYNFRYCIPRWQTVSGSQYAYSPSTVCALPDARLIQAMTLSLLEAGEKAANPPMVATQEVVRSDVQLWAGGLTWVDHEYDERLGDALRPLSQDTSGLQYGFRMQESVRSGIMEAFYLNKLSFPEMGREMTAFEVGQRVQEYIRSALPLFEPMEMEYNGALCEMTFDLLMRNGAFGSADDIPPSLRGESIRFRFESPLKEAGDKAKGQRLMEASNLLATVMPYDQTLVAEVDFRTALRDALDGIGVAAKWIRPEEEAMGMVEGMKQESEAQAAVGQLAQGAEAAQMVGEAGQALGGMQ